MKFSSHEDIAAPIAEVFAAYSDFDGFERSALRRGADVARTDKLKEAGVGMCWDGAFRFRGRKRVLSGELVDFSAPDGYAVDLESVNLSGMFELELVPLSKTRTRVALRVEIKPKSLSGRLMVQSMKLGKARLSRRFKIASSEFAKSIEDNLAAAA